MIFSNTAQKKSCEALLASMAVQCNQILLGLAQSPDVTSHKHAELIVNFVNMVLGMLPFGIHLEHLLSARIGNINLADCILLDGAARYTAAINTYKGMLNQWHQSAVAGKLGDRKGAYKAIEFQAEKLFANAVQLQVSLLTLPMNKQVESFSLEAAA